MTINIIRGDARNLPLPDESVDLIVTSPPYFALRSYSDGGEHYAGQVGSEATPAEFIEALLDCTREMVRVLKPTGSIWVNLGDKYANSSGSGPRSLPGGDKTSSQWTGRLLRKPAAGAPNKSLLLLPERYRIACVDQLGLIARAVVIWSKPNGLPESVTDRVRRSHEDWVHLTKQPRYFAAVDEIREAHVTADAITRIRTSDYAAAMSGRMNGAGNPLGKLPGSVWEIATQPLTVPAELGVDHFAAFPMEWPRRIILGWSPSGICVACGEGRRPVVDQPGLLGGDNNPHSRDGSHALSTMDGGSVNWARRMANPDRIVGYSCGCPPCPKCDDSRESWLVAGKPCHACPPTRPAVVLDPFGGTGTTALMADVLGRHGISVDMSADYCRLAQWRTGDQKQRERAQRPPKPPKPRPAPVTPSTPAEWLAHFGITEGRT